MQLPTAVITPVKSSVAVNQQDFTEFLQGYIKIQQLKCQIYELKFAFRYIFDNKS